MLVLPDALLALTGTALALGAILIQVVRSRRVGSA